MTNDSFLLFELRLPEINIVQKLYGNRKVRNQSSYIENGTNFILRLTCSNEYSLWSHTWINWNQPIWENWNTHIVTRLAVSNCEKILKDRRFLKEKYQGATKHIIYYTNYVNLYHSINFTSFLSPIGRFVFSINLSFHTYPVTWYSQTLKETTHQISRSINCWPRNFANFAASGNYRVTLIPRAITSSGPSQNRTIWRREHLYTYAFPVARVRTPTRGREVERCFGVRRIRAMEKWMEVGIQVWSYWQVCICWNLSIPSYIVVIIQVYSYVFFITETKSTVRLRGLAVIIRDKRRKHDFLMVFWWFFGIK